MVREGRCLGDKALSRDVPCLSGTCSCSGLSPNEHEPTGTTNVALSLPVSVIPFLHSCGMGWLVPWTPSLVKGARSGYAFPRRFRCHAECRRLTSKCLDRENKEGRPCQDTWRVAGSATSGKTASDPEGHRLVQASPRPQLVIQPAPSAEVRPVEPSHGVSSPGDHRKARCPILPRPF
jgi:hypothetical protein